MRYQLPDNVSSIAVGVHEFTADADGTITVPADADASIHAALQDKAKWGLKVMDDEAGTPEPATPDLAPDPQRKQKGHMVALLRSLGFAVDGRATFEWLRRKLVAELSTEDLGDDGELKGAAPSAETTAAPPA